MALGPPFPPVQVLIYNPYMYFTHPSWYKPCPFANRREVIRPAPAAGPRRQVLGRRLSRPEHLLDRGGGSALHCRHLRVSLYTPTYNNTHPSELLLAPLDTTSGAPNHYIVYPCTRQQSNIGRPSALHFTPLGLTWYAPRHVGGAPRGPSRRRV